MEYNYYESTEKYCAFCHAPIKLRSPKDGGELEELECSCERSQKAKDDKCAYCGKPIRYELIPLVGGMGRMTRIDCECERKAREEQEAAARAERVVAGEKIVRESWLERCGLSTRLKGCTFDSFIPSSQQRVAYDAAKCFQPVNDEYIGLILCGGVGCGKTHLAAAMVHKAIEEHPISDELAERIASDPRRIPSSPVLFIGTAALFRELRDCYNSKERSETETMRRFMSAGLLVLDDLGTEKNTEWTEEKLFEIIDYRYNEYLPTIITTNCTPEELKKHVGDRTFDRLRSMCRYIPITDNSHRQTAAPSAETTGK